MVTFKPGAKFGTYSNANSHVAGPVPSPLSIFGLAEPWHQLLVEEDSTTSEEDDEDGVGGIKLVNSLAML